MEKYECDACGWSGPVDSLEYDIDSMPICPSCGSDKVFEVESDEEGDAE